MENLKAFSILLLFVWHSASQSISYFAIALMMPIFAFASGYSTKSVNLGSFSKKIFSIFIFAHYVIPFTSRNLFRDAFVFDSPDNIIDFFLFKNNVGILWYLLALLVWVRLGKILLKTRHPFLLSIVGSVLVLLVLDLLPHFKIIQDPVGKISDWYNFINSVKFFPFYMLGLALDWKKIVDMRYSNWKYFYGALLVIVTFLFANGTFSFGVIITDLFLLTVSHIVCGVIALMGIICVFPGRNIATFTDIGSASLNIYILHIMFISFFNYMVFNVFGVDFAAFSGRGIIQTLIDPITVLNLVYMYFVSWMLSRSVFMMCIIAPTNWTDYLLFDTKLPKRIDAS